MGDDYRRHPIGRIHSTLQALEDAPRQGLHRVTVHEIAGTRLRIGPIEAIDGTPVVDIKAVLSAPVDG